MGAGEGMENEFAMVEELLGDVNMTTSEWLDYLLEAGDVSMGLGEVVMLYAPSTLFFSVLAFWVFRWIAKRNGNWEKICGFFGKKSEESRPLFTVPLMVAAAIGIVLMFVYELLLKLPKAV